MNEIQEQERTIARTKRDIARQERYVAEYDAEIGDETDFLDWAEDRLAIHLEADTDGDGRLSFSNELGLRMAILEVRRDRRRAAGSLQAEQEEREAEIEGLAEEEAELRRLQSVGPEEKS